MKNKKKETHKKTKTKQRGQRETKRKREKKMLPSIPLVCPGRHLVLIRPRKSSQSPWTHCLIATRDREVKGVTSDVPNRLLGRRHINEL
jgi:hypothetical protein